MLILFGVRAAAAGEITMTSGYVTYGDGTAVRVYIENGNPPTDGGVDVPACTVHVAIVGSDGTIIGEGDVQAEPGEENFYQTALPAIPGTIDSFAADMTFTKSGLCSTKTLLGFLNTHDVPTNAAFRAYELQFRRSSRFN